jgi:DNA polymerase III epsilon subunit-like protein
VLADEPATFADAVSSLLLDTDRRRSIEAVAATHAARFDWTVVVRQFEHSLAQTISDRSPRR